jgi:hypothetical protein
MLHHPMATQRLRDMIDELSSGLHSFDDLQNELSNIELRLGLPITHPSTAGTLEFR